MVLSGIAQETQDVPPENTTQTYLSGIDSLRADTLKNMSFLSDTLKPDTVKRKSEIDTTILYSAEKVEFTFNPQVTILTGKAEISYRLMNLKADKIEIHWEENMVYAEGRLDTIRNVSFARGTSLAIMAGESDTLSPVEDTDSADSTVWIGLPEMKDGSQTIVGKYLTYNLKTKHGRVIEGTTGFQEGSYVGETIKMVDKNVYYIRSGHFTTCDEDHPHYSFWSRNLKLTVKDKVIARPVVLYFGPVPVLIIPFGVFPAKGGRHSGLIVPVYGESSIHGRYFNNLGYYWAPNDYFDAKATLDFREREGIVVHGASRYTRRYIYGGNLAGSFTNLRESSGLYKKWEMRLNHSHTLSPSASLIANLTFVSDSKYYKDISNNQYDRLRQTTTSNVTLSKRWGSLYSGSMNLNYTRNLATGIITESIPVIGFSRGQSPIFSAGENIPVDEHPWWTRIYYSYGFRGVNNLQINTKPERNSLYKSGINHTVSLSGSQKPFEYLALTPRVTYAEAWFDDYLDYSRPADGNVISTKQEGFRARRTYTAGADLNTKLYGLFHPRVFSIDALRHTLSPSVGFTYMPDFSDPKWGYYQVFSDSTGEKKFDRFEGSVNGDTPEGESMSISMSIRNLFEYKRIVEEKEEKGKLFTINWSTSHNFVADSLKWGDLTTTASISPLAKGDGSAGVLSSLSGLSLDMTGKHSFYNLITDPNSSRKVVINSATPDFLRLKYFSLSTSFRIKSSRRSESRRDSTRIDTFEIATFPVNRFEDPMWTPSPVPWEAGISFSYSEDHNDPDRIIKNTWMTVGTSFQMTQNWKVTYDTRFDLIRKRVVSSNISIYRDLHCWEGRFTWSPLGINSGFYMIISVKSQQLKDVKVEKRKGGGGVFGY